MITIIVTSEDGTVERHVFDLREVTIGRNDKNHLALPAAVISSRHARIVEKDGRYILVDLKSMNGTYVNGRKITAPLLVKTGDRITVGTFVLELDSGEPPELQTADESIEDYDEDDPTIDRSEPGRPPTARPPEAPPVVGRDPVETQLLAAIAQRDDSSRLVYADWLEQRGEAQRAEFLRVQQELMSIPPEHPRFRERSERLRQLGAVVDVGWKYAVARPTIERCDVKFDFQCPKEWGSLSRTDKPTVRYCGSCKRNVHYAASLDLARQLAVRGECVVVDVVPLRRPGDLDPPRIMMGGAMAAPPAMTRNPPAPRRTKLPDE